MSLLAKHPKALQFLFNEDLYHIEEKALESTQPESASLALLPAEKPTFNYLGENNRFFVLLVNEPEHPHLAPAQLETLSKILQAKGLQMADVALVNLAKHPPCNFAQLHDFFSFNKLCLFGISPSNLGLPAMASNEPIAFERTHVLATFSIAEMQQTQHKKVAFWHVMKTF